MIVHYSISTAGDAAHVRLADGPRACRSPDTNAHSKRGQQQQAIALPLVAALSIEVAKPVVHLVEARKVGGRGPQTRTRSSPRPATDR